MKNINKEAHIFLDKVLKEIHLSGINIHNWEIDHLCYRTSSTDNYSKIKADMEQVGTLLAETPVNGRPIATYKLHTPIIYQKYIINLIEVPAPKVGKDTIEGFEHIEIVFDEDFQSFMNSYPQVNFDTKGLTKEFNKELVVKFGDCSVKFHHKSLEHVINIEENKLINSFLIKSNILNNFKDYYPCISGTLPLKISTPESDLDILFTCPDLQEFEAMATRYFSNEKDFQVTKSVYQNLNAVIINFNFNSLPIELFCQELFSFKQQANQHFLVEGRLLKILGDTFKQNIQKQKLNGIKTEPVFGILLGLKDPYLDLIELGKKSDLELKNLFQEVID